MCALFSRFNNSSISTSCLFFSFFFVRHFGPIIKKKVFRLLVKSDFCRHFYLYSPLFFPWEEEDEGLFIIIFGLLLSCVSIVTRARLERTKEEEALTHLSTERERERERGATDDHHHRDCFCGALCVTFFWRRVFDSRRRRRFVRRRERCGSDDSSRSETAISAFLSRARARTRFERKKDTPSPPAVASLRETGDRRIA